LRANILRKKAAVHCHYLLLFPSNSMTKVGHIYLIDDDESMRTSLSRMLKDVGYIVEDFSSAVTFLEHSVPVAPAVILLDMQMPDMTGLDLQEKLVQLGRKTPIVFVSGQSHPHQIVKSLKRGAVDFLFKPFNLEDLLKAVADALEFDRRQLKRLSKEVETKKDYATLTPREREVCFWLVKGLLNKDIAVKLGTTDATIKVHKARVMDKMNVESVQVLVAKYLESDLENFQKS
jgi:FixJ family two-component response regulator